MDKLQVYTALVTFERANNYSLIPPAEAILPSEVQGACGYMAVAAHSEEDVFQVLRNSLATDGLRVIEVNEIMEVSIVDFPDLDDQLTENVRVWEPGKPTVWGTIYMYLAEGEA